MPKSSKKGLNRRQLEQALLDVVHDNPTVAYNYKQISAAIGAKSLSERQLVISILDALAANETVDEVEHGKYKLNTRAGYVEGVIDRRSNGKTYLVPDDGGSAIFIAERRLRHALNKDRVRVFLYARPKGSEPEGEVVEILKRAQDTFVGVLQVGRNYAFLRVDNKILTTIIDKFRGGPVGVSTIATAIGEDGGTVEEVYEPFLIMEGFIKRTPRGRMATKLAYEHLGRNPYGSNIMQGDLFE